MVTVNKKRRTITFSCDHAGCRKRTERYVGVEFVCKETGTVLRTMRNTTASYWRKVLGNPRRKDSRKFFLLGAHFPDGVTVFCEEHFNLFNEEFNALKKLRLKRAQEQEARRYK